MTTGTLMGSVRKARRGVGIAGPGRPQRRPRRHRTTRGMTFALFAAPSILLLLLLTLYPLLYAGQQSLRNGDLIDAGSFVGLRNYTGILTSPSFWHAAEFTVVFTVVGVFGSWAVGLGLALLLRPGVPGPRHPQGAAAPAVGRADRSLVHVLELAGRHPPESASVPVPSTSASAMSSSWPTLRWAQGDRLHLQGLGQLPVHDDDDGVGAGHVDRREHLRGRPASTALPVGRRSGRSPCR